jgi:hypothetical protein
MDTAPPPAIVRPACDAAAKARILAPARPGDEVVNLTCSLRLGAGERVTKRLLLEGSAASGVGIECDGGAVGPGEAGTGLADFAVEIRSKPPAPGAQAWDRPTDIAIRGCAIFGHVRIWGMGLNGQGPAVRDSSHSLGHTERAQAAAPTRIGLVQVVITAFGRIPVYAGPGVTRLELRDSRIGGHSVATAVYLDAESADNAITNNTFDIRTGREIVAVDGSARNAITGNRFDLHGQGAVRLYRNCGEGGTVRHQTPSDNVVTGNTFRGAGWFTRPVVLNSRNGWDIHCAADSGYPFGSSADNGDNGTGNVVEPNTTE